MRELDHCREKCCEANAISKGNKYITMRYGQKKFLSLRWLKDLEYMNCVEMAEYFSARMINYEGVFQCCFPIGCVAEGDEDHLISRVGKPQDLQSLRSAMLSASPNLVLRMKECSYHSERFMEAMLQAGILGYTQKPCSTMRWMTLRSERGIH
eukprot:scaffold67_cov95-Skeletonema_dohrnii-CCMP3373.AAC.2